MRSSITLAESLRLVLREVSRSPWICLSALRREKEEQVDTNPAADGDPVLVLGGFLSHPYYYAPLGRILARRGYAVHFDEALNARPLRPHLAELCVRADAIAQASGSPIRIVGHSLGGIQAMALLLQRPDLVGQIVAVASPVAGGTPWRPLQRLTETILKVRGRDARLLAKRAAAYAERITTISSPHDRVAPPSACSVAGAANVVLNVMHRADHTLESHGGVIFMRAAVREILNALARPPAFASPRLAAV